MANLFFIYLQKTSKLCLLVIHLRGVSSISMLLAKINKNEHNIKLISIILKWCVLFVFSQIIYIIHNTFLWITSVLKFRLIALIFC